MLERLGAAPQPVAHPLRDPPDPAQRAVVGEHDRAEDRDDGEDREPDQRGVAQAFVDAAVQQRRDRQHGQREDDREHEHVDRGQRGHGRRPPATRSGSASCTAAPRPSPRRPARSSPARHRRAGRRSPAASGAPAARPAAAPTRTRARPPAAPAIAASEAGEKRRDVAPRAEHLDQAREDEIDRHAGDDEPEDRPAQPARLALVRPLDLRGDVGVRLDRVLDAIAERLTACGRRLQVNQRRGPAGERGSLRRDDPASPGLPRRSLVMTQVNDADALRAEVERLREQNATLARRVAWRRQFRRGSSAPAAGARLRARRALARGDLAAGRRCSTPIATSTRSRRSPREPEVQRAVAAKLETAIFSRVDFAGLAREVLPGAGGRAGAGDRARRAGRHLRPDRGVHPLGALPGAVGRGQPARAHARRGTAHRRAARAGSGSRTTRCISTCRRPSTASGRGCRNAG